jgi:hypothetical protein
VGKDVKVYFKSSSTAQNRNIRINLFNSSKVWQSQEVLQLAIEEEGTKIITPTYNGYIRVSANYSGIATVDWTTASIAELLGTATAENLLKVGTYQDEQSVIDGGVTRKVGIKILDGSGDWEQSNTKNDVYRLTLTDAKREQQAILSTHFIGTDAADVNMPSNSIKVGSYAAIPNAGVIAIRLTDVTTLADFKQFLADQYQAGFPVIIVYPLATATTETVTGQPLTTQEGTNIVEITQASMDNLELEVSYKAGVAVTITEVENAQLSNNVEVTING